MINILSISGQILNPSVILILHFTLRVYKSWEFLQKSNICDLWYVSAALNGYLWRTITWITNRMGNKSFYGIENVPIHWTFSGSIYWRTCFVEEISAKGTLAPLQHMTLIIINFIDIWVKMMVIFMIFEIKLNSKMNKICCLTQ